MRLPHRVVGVLLVGLLAVSPGACDGDDDVKSDCALTLSVSGDLTASLADGDATCGTGLSIDMGLDVLYIPFNGGALKAVDLSIDELTQGATGEGFVASLRIRSQDDQVWEANDCVVTIDAHEAYGTSEFGEDYRVAGSGTCPSNATDGAEGSLTVAPFDFVAVITWRA